MRALRRSRTVAGVAGVLAVAALLPDGPARAAGDACFDSYVKAQLLRKDRKPIEAREQLVICSQPTCPALAQKDCTKWLSEIDAEKSTVLFVVRDEAGRDLLDATVYVDDVKVADSIDGRPIPLDPGVHTVRFVAGGRTFEQKIVVAIGEQNRRVLGTFAAQAAAPAATGGAGRHIPTISWVLGGAAAVGLVSFVGFAVGGRVQQQCAPTCSQGQVDALRRDYLVADVSWITGLAALGGAFTFWLVQPSRPAAEPVPSASPAPAPAALGVTPLPGGAGLALSGSF